MRGNALIGQSGGPTSVINASLVGLVDVSRTMTDIDSIYGMRYGIEGFMQEEIIDLAAEETALLSSLREVPSSALGSCRYKLSDGDLPKILSLLGKYNIRYLFLIGGNDTMDTLARIESYCSKNDYSLIGIGVPKTVDNDLYGTDHTPGYPSAAKYVALSVQQSGQLARDMQRVDSFVTHQTVGRDAGWLAASAALAKFEKGDPPHLIYLPERPLSKDRFLGDVENCMKQYGWVYIVCGEGIVWEDGSPVSASKQSDDFANVEFGAMGGGSAAINLHGLFSSHFGMRGEFQITESLSMAAADRVTERDREEAYNCGVEAVKLAGEGKSGYMVSIERVNDKPYQAGFGAVSLADAGERSKAMPSHFINEEGNFPSEDFLDYIRPLLEEEISPYPQLSYIKASF